MQGIIFDKSYKSVLEKRLINICVRPRNPKPLQAGQPIVVAVEDNAGEPYPVYYATVVITLPMTITKTNVHVCNRDLKPQEVEALAHGAGHPNIRSFLDSHQPEGETFSGALVVFQ